MGIEESSSGFEPQLQPQQQQLNVVSPEEPKRQHCKVSTGSLGSPSEQPHAGRRLTPTLTITLPSTEELRGANAMEGNNHTEQRERGSKSPKETTRSLEGRVEHHVSITRPVGIRMLSVFDTCGIVLPKATPYLQVEFLPVRYAYLNAIKLAKFLKGTTPYFNTREPLMSSSQAAFEVSEASKVRSTGSPQLPEERQQKASTVSAPPTTTDDERAFRRQPFIPVQEPYGSSVDTTSQIKRLSSGKDSIPMHLNSFMKVHLL
uniref:Uncharacterized protein n=1 Tax=Timema monikensis TaxID=170555 RepID=A0A7R9EH80_9NEOP|nr:unnamed protein product [Timema monikensis]